MTKLATFDDPAKTSSLVVQLIRKGFWGPLYYDYNKEPQKRIIIRNPQKEFVIN